MTKQFTEYSVRSPLSFAVLPVHRGARGGLGWGRSNQGFTLLELLLVVGMLGIISLLFISYTGDVGNVSVDAASWKVQSDIRYAQQLATNKGTTHGVDFVRNGNYTVYSGTTSTPVSDPLKHIPMIENLDSFGDLSINNNYRVEFDKFGKPTLGGGGNVEILADSGARRRVYVIDTTGAVIVDVLDYGSGCSCGLCNE